MFNSEVLDVVIGLVFIYLLYSLFATILQELIATYLFNLRSKVLELAIVLEDKSTLSRSRILNLFRFLVSNNVGSLIKFLSKDKSSPSKRRILDLFLYPVSNIAGDQSTFSGQFYEHALIKFLGEDNNSRKPSYLTSETFSKVVIDLLRGKDVKPGDDIKAKIQSSLVGGKITVVANSSLTSVQIAGTAIVSICPETLSFLNSIWADAQGDVDKFKAMLEKWFDETMKRTTGWYKKYTQSILFVVGLVLAIAFNVNTIEIVHKLEKDPNLRAQVVAQADNFLKAHPNLEKELALALSEDSSKVKRSDTVAAKKMNSLTVAQYDSLKARRDTLIETANRLVKADMEKTNNLLGLGWDGRNGFLDTLFHTSSILGWLMTAIAISLGAPFWFDLLNKLMKLRSSVTSDTDDDKKNKSTDANKTVIDRKG
jgi:hypothetical protein